MRRMKFVVAAIAVMAIAVVAYTVPKVYFESGTGNLIVQSGGQVILKSGATLDTQSGSTVNLSGKTIEFTRYLSAPTDGGLDSLAITGLDTDDYVSATVTSAQAAGDSAVVLRKVVPGSDKAYLYFSAIPTDSMQVDIIHYKD